jgi:hypothetical protein
VVLASTGSAGGKLELSLFSGSLHKLVGND